jgi:hypothetical protein
MTYRVNVWWSDEDKSWLAEGENFRGLAMQANSLDLLVERTNLAISDLLEIDEFQVEYLVKSEAKY